MMRRFIITILALVVLAWLGLTIENQVKLHQLQQKFNQTIYQPVQ